MADRYVDYLPLQVGAWLRRGMGGVLLEAVGMLGDVLVDLGREAVRVHFVERQTENNAADAQDATGSERSIERYAGESNASFGARLLNAFVLMADNGRPAGLTTEMAGLGWPATTFEAATFDPTSPRWARFWIFVDSSVGHGVTPAPPIGMGWKIGDGTLVGIGGVSPDKLRRLRRSIVVWKPAHMHLQSVIFLISGHPVGTGWVVGQAGYTVGGTSVRLNNATY